MIFVDTSVFMYAVGREHRGLHLAGALDGEHPSLSARDLVHVACCRRRGVGEVMTFDRGLAAVLG